jgi:hypothetical protein
VNDPIVKKGRSIRCANPSQAKRSALPIASTKDENGRKTSRPFSTFTFEYEYENKSGKARHENKHELTEYREFQKRTNSSGIMSNTIGIRKINTEY